MSNFILDFIFERADGSRRSVKGYKYAKPKAGTQLYSNKRYKESELPNKVDLRKQMTPVENQGDTNSCAANAVAGAYEYLAKMHTGEDYDVSRMFIYYNARYLAEDSEDYEIEDEGSYIEKAIDGLKEYGACSEETYPFDEDLVNDEPDQDAYDEAAEFLIEDAVLAPTNLYAWKHSLAEGYPIVFGINLYKSFDKQRKKGLVPMPSDSEASRKDHGGHAMLAVGYSDQDKVFIVRNSWGEEWGDKGYCYIPYDYLMNPKFNDGDSWIIRQLENVDFDNQACWDDSEESVVGDYESELANMSDDDYEAMLEAMGDYAVEYRIALLFLQVASADGDLSDEEYDEIANYMAETIEKLGVEMNSEKILRYAVRDLDNTELIEESIVLLGEHFSSEMLAKIISDLQGVVGIDGLSKQENDSIDELVNAWQIQEGDEEQDEDEGEDEEDDEDDEDENEEDDENANRKKGRRR